MSSVTESVLELRTRLEERDLSGFLAAYEALDSSQPRPPGLTELTQKILPCVLRDRLRAGTVRADDVVCLWRLVRSSRLLVVDDEIIEGINGVLHQAWRQINGSQSPLPEKLRTFGKDDSPFVEAVPSTTATATIPRDAVPMRRICIVNAFTVGAPQVSDAFSFKKNVCASGQEREFLKAVRQFFPNLRAYPNVPVRNFIDVDVGGFVATVSDRHRRYAWSAQVDVLLCTEDEDPVASIELDSVHHDLEDARERDQLKDEIHRLAGVPLVRVRADDTRAVRADDFYSLLMAMADELEKLRPRRLRMRTSHDILVPAQAMSATTSVG